MSCAIRARLAHCSLVLTLVRRHLRLLSRDAGIHLLLSCASDAEDARVLCECRRRQSSHALGVVVARRLLLLLLLLLEFAALQLQLHLCASAAVVQAELAA